MGRKQFVTLFENTSSRNFKKSGKLLKLRYRTTHPSSAFVTVAEICGY